MALTQLKLHHGAISVPDIDASIAWYREMLGFEIEKRFEIPGGLAQVAMLLRGDMRIELFQPGKGEPMSEDRRHPNRDILTHGNKHVAFAVPNARAAAEDLVARGADLVFIGEFEFGSNAFFRDNAGNLVELVQEPSMWVATPGSPA